MVAQVVIFFVILVHHTPFSWQSYNLAQFDYKIYTVSRSSFDKNCVTLYFLFCYTSYLKKMSTLNLKFAKRL